MTPEPGTPMVEQQVAACLCTDHDDGARIWEMLAHPWPASPTTPAGHVLVPTAALRIARMAVASWVNSSLADEGNRAALSAIDAAIAAAYPRKKDTDG